MKSDKGKLGLVVFFGVILLLGSLALGALIVYIAFLSSGASKFDFKNLKFDFNDISKILTEGKLANGNEVIKLWTIDLKWILIGAIAATGAGWLASMITIFAGKWTSSWCRKSFVVCGILAFIPIVPIIFGGAGLTNLKKKDNFSKRNKTKAPMYQQPVMQQPMMQQPMMPQMPQQSMMQQPMMAQPVMMAPNTNSSMSQNSQLIPFYIPIEHVEAFRIATASIGQGQATDTSKPALDEETWSFDEF